MLGQIRSVSSLDCYHFYHELNALKQCNMTKLTTYTKILRLISNKDFTVGNFDAHIFRSVGLPETHHFLFGLIMNWLV